MPQPPVCRDFNAGPRSISKFERKSNLCFCSHLVTPRLTIPSLRADVLLMQTNRNYRSLRHLLLRSPNGSKNRIRKGGDLLNSTVSASMLSVAPSITCSGSPSFCHPCLYLGAFLSRSSELLWTLSIYSRPQGKQVASTFSASFPTSSK